MRRAPSAILALLVVLAYANAAGAFDSGREAANVSKPRERPRLEPASQPLPAKSIAVHYVNRNGALISAHVWLAPHANRGRKRPAVVFVGGDIAPETVYWFAAAAFARAGYVVLSYDPQGHGASESTGYGTTAQRHVAIQEGEGALGDGPTDEDAVEQAKDALAFLLSSHGHPYIPPRYDGRRYDPRHLTPGQQRQRLASHTRHAAPYNPLYAYVNPHRLGLVGHSRGADAVSILAARDRRLRAVVAWDDLIPQTFDARPVKLHFRVPALGIADDYYETPVPFTSAPDPQQHSPGFQAARAAGVDSGELVIRGGTHYEFSYQAGLPLPATLRGIDFATWYATAWLDRYLKGDPSALRRLLTARWRHDTAEAAVDPSHDGNLFSFYFRSPLAIHVPASGKHRRALFCPDLRNGCRYLVPAGGDGGPRRYAVLVPEPR